ncbi:small ubiquitin-related modifier 2-A-like [Oscarella lobularis]|uniref:small ubiquitin-related modifier 2-A-like n=1 Tax=Oscarella lobularis TaxID=121494 RepID=UPI0033139E1A
MADGAKPDVKSETDDHINLIVTFENGPCTEVHFKMRKTASFKKLMLAFSDRQGIQRNTLRFLFDGRRIAENDTPANLEMEQEEDTEGVTIEAHLRQIAG